MNMVSCWASVSLALCLSALFPVKLLAFEGRHAVVEHGGGMGEFGKGLNVRHLVLLGFAFSGLGFLAALADLTLGLF